MDTKEKARLFAEGLNKYRNDPDSPWQLFLLSDEDLTNEIANDSFGSESEEFLDELKANSQMTFMVFPTEHFLKISSEARSINHENVYVYKEYETTFIYPANDPSFPVPESYINDIKRKYGHIEFYENYTHTPDRVLYSSLSDAAKDIYYYHVNELKLHYDRDIIEDLRYSTKNDDVVYQKENEYKNYAIEISKILNGVDGRTNLQGFYFVPVVSSKNLKKRKENYGPNGSALNRVFF